MKPSTTEEFIKKAQHIVEEHLQDSEFDVQHFRVKWLWVAPNYL